MGRERSVKLAQGVRVRTYASGGKSIEIQFQYRGDQCKETLSALDPDKKGNQRYAINLKAEVEGAIERQTFRYDEFFPESKRAQLFGHAISQATIRELIEDWLKDIKRTHPHSTHRCYNKSCNAHPLRAILDRALNDDVIERNPLDKIKVSKLVDRSQATTNYKVDPFTKTEIETILKHALQYDPRIRNIFKFAFFSGLRTSELFGLQWGDVDWDKSEIHVQRAVVERLLKETKTQSSNRKVILLPAAYEALSHQKQFSYVGRDYIFVRPGDKGRFIDYEHLERPWKHILKLAGIRYRNPYQSRHTYASQLLSGGENPLFVAQQMGHKTTEMIMRHYGRWVEQAAEDQKHVFVSSFGQGVKETRQHYSIEETHVSNAA